MALNGKYVSLDQIIEKVYRDTDIKDQIDVADCAEWAGEALDLIAAPTSLHNKVASIPIVEGRGELPCDLHSIVQVREFDTKSAMRATTDTFHRHFKRDGSSSSSSTPTIGEGLYANEAYQDVEGIFNNNTADDTANKKYDELTYEINNNYIFPNFKEGDVEMAYKAFPVSETGLPLIPDNQSFKKAVEYYIRHHINHKMWRAGLIRDKVYQKEEQDKDWYIAKAQTQARLPTYDEMEAIKNDHLRLIPDIHQWSDFFETTGSPHVSNNVGYDHGSYYHGPHRI